MSLPRGCLTLAPTGFEHPDPPDDAIGRILRLALAGRLYDVKSLRDRIVPGDEIKSIWLRYADAIIAYSQDSFVQAEELAQECAAQALQVGLVEPKQSGLQRLAASGLELAGGCMRRCERYVEAEHIHKSAFTLRSDFGEPAERMESATSLGLCREWTEDYAGAEHWYSLAASMESTDPRGANRSAWANIRLSMLLTEQSRHDESIFAARAAQRILEMACPGEIPSLVANLHVAQSMIKRVELMTGGSEAKAELAKILEMLAQTQMELLAFGAVAESDLEWCEQQIDFVSRLWETVS